MAGFYLGQTGDRLFIAPLPGDGTPADPFADAEIERVVEITRDDVLRIVTRRPAGLRTDDPGRDQAQTLLVDLQAQQIKASRRKAERPIRTKTPVRDFAPLAHLHAKERFWPMSANRDVPWYAVRRVSAQESRRLTHPVVYVAKNSHASYPRAGDYLEERQTAGNKRVSARDRAIACPACPQWRTWDKLHNAAKAPWYGFGGAWGNIGAQGGTNGPLGPSPRKTCRAPRCPQADGRR